LRAAAAKLPDVGGPERVPAELVIRPWRPEDRDAARAIVNAAAEAYRGIIPTDCWCEPDMGAEELNADIVAGVSIWGAELDGDLIGVMGVQAVRDVDLIRHAYV
jgi:hypothetical protein